jgi:hypothetical protein
LRDLVAESGRIVPEIGLAMYRELIYKRAYRVIYRVESTRVAILTVRNCAEEFDEAEVRRKER